MAVDPGGVAGAVPAALRRSTEDVRSSDPLLRPAEDLLGLGPVDRARVVGVPGVLLRTLILCALVRALGRIIARGLARFRLGLFRRLRLGGLLRLGLGLGLRLGGRLGSDDVRVDSDRGLLIALLRLSAGVDGRCLVLELDRRLLLGLGRDRSFVVGSLSGSGEDRCGEQSAAGGDDCGPAAECAGIRSEQFAQLGQWCLGLDVGGAAAVLLRCHDVLSLPVCNDIHNCNEFVIFCHVSVTKGFFGRLRVIMPGHRVREEGSSRGKAVDSADSVCDSARSLRFE